MIQDLAYNVLTGVSAHSLYKRVNPPLGVVFMCHSVEQPINRDFDPNGKWRITTDQLEMAIHSADTMGFEAVTLDTVADRLNGKTGDRPFYTLTFDDGYADNLHAALPVCQQYKVPITVYVTSGFIQRTHVAWWHLLEDLIANKASIQVTIKGSLSRLDCASHSEKQKTFDQLSKFLTLTSVKNRVAFIDEICNRYGDSSKTYAENLFMDESELLKFSANEYAHIGNHGLSHSAFANLETKELERELLDCTEYLTTLTASKPHHLAYPYGTSSTVSERDFDIARNQGFTTAVTTQHGTLYKGAQSQTLSRIPLFPSDTDNGLKCKLTGITTLLASLRDKMIYKG